MSGLKQKREELAKELRQKNREEIKAGLRSIALNRLCGSEMPLISTVLQKFSDLNHYQLTQHADEIIDVLNYTVFQELSDDQHDEIVTDLFYLIHQKIIGCPFFIKFKKNQSPYTASLVAYLSADLEAEQILYWFNFMCQQDKKLVISMVEGEQVCESKWVTNKKLFIYLLQNLKLFSQAAIVYKSILLNCDQLTKKDIDQSIKYIIQAITYSHQQQNVEVHSAVIGLSINVLQAYFKMKQKKVKVLELLNLVKKQLIYNIQIFANPDILADINKLYELQQNDYLGNEETCERILSYVENRLRNGQFNFKNEELEYYLNNLFRLYYNHWRSIQLWEQDYKYPLKIKQSISKLGGLAANNVWFIKLKNIMI